MTDQIPVILFENAEFLVLNKPSGWHSVMGKGDARGEHSVEAWLRDRDSEAEHLPEAGLIHRLDRGTSGCLIVAKTFEASDILQEQTSQRRNRQAVPGRHRRKASTSQRRVRAAF